MQIDFHLPEALELLKVLALGSGFMFEDWMQTLDITFSQHVGFVFMIVL